MMKIIGKTDDGYILTATKDDIAGIQGYYRTEKRNDIGDCIDAYGLFRKYNSVSSAFKQIDQLRNAAEILNSAADFITQFNKED